MPDIVIVGAGAAGVSAARALSSLGVSCIILEASNRIGGRAFTDRTSLPGQWEQGCQWFHSAAANPLAKVAASLDWPFERQDRTSRAMTFFKGRWLTSDEEEACHNALVAAFESVYSAAKEGRDLPIASVLPKAGAWQPFVDNLFQQLISEDPSHTSALGYGDYDDDTGENWIVTGGLGALIKALAIDLPIKLNTIVTSVTETASGVQVESSHGTLQAKAAIVTASTNVLLSGAIQFGASRVDQLLEKMQDLPCGAYEKIAFAFGRLPFAASDLLFYNLLPRHGQRPFTFQVVDGPEPKLIAHVGGDTARELAAKGRDEMVGLALEYLVAAFGNDVARPITGTAVTTWQANPWVRGAYSYAKVGCGKSRREMIAIDTGRVRFAGEAFSRHSYATVHGAWQSGRDVAADLSAKLREKV